LAQRLDFSRAAVCQMSDPHGPNIFQSPPSAPSSKSDVSVASGTTALRAHRLAIAVLRRLLGTSYDQTRMIFFRANTSLRKMLNFEVVRLWRECAAARRLLDRQATDVL